MTRRSGPLWLIGCGAAALAGLAWSPPGAGARKTKPKPAPLIVSVRCTGRGCAADARRVAPGGSVRVIGRRFERGMRVYFLGTSARTKRISLKGARWAGATPRGRTHVVAVVPRNATSGFVVLRTRDGRISNRGGPLTVARPAPRPPPRSPGVATAFDGNGIWIFLLSRLASADPDAIATQAKQHGLTTVYIKSSDAASYNTQFSARLVSALKARGLRVCAWPYVYGDDPSGEAAASARAVTNGADCLVIDAETEYEGRYSQAQQYIRALRSRIGDSYPLGLSGFPYVDYHPSFPYSVFLGPGGAQFNVPQMYWRAIGVSVDSVYDHTYSWNRLYGAAIYPLGQLYDDPPPSQIVRFRQLAGAYGARGLSWFDWQNASTRGFDATGSALPALSGFTAQGALPTVGRGARGDVVVWAQQHLISAGQSVTADGGYGAQTETAVRNFQASKGLPVSGSIDAPTWQALMRYAPTVRAFARASRAGARGVSGPPSAALPAVADELRGGAPK
ncbi:MAG: hypothetical protein QOK04_2116 [Solirubrobacteraceae bacterium]|nr:hypothetical protein [Solirubrobacteraceae bacterium]